MGRKEKYRVFRPRRRAFLGRRKPLLSPGTWTFGFVGIAFGAFVNTHWAPDDRRSDAVAEPVAVLAAPPPAAPLPAEPEAAETAVTALPVNLVAEARPAPQTDAAKPASPPATDDTDAHTGAVAKVVDGDTFYLDGVEARFRLWGVDAPEKNAPGAAEATEALTNLVSGRTLACEEMDRDRYARIVARCTLDDGRDIARVLIDIGAAIETPRYSGGYYGG
jgi:endonuclease YncB( thermonuclease family)